MFPWKYTRAVLSQFLVQMALEKTTLIKSISGAVKVASGQILLNGEDITNKDSYKIASKKVMQSPERQNDISRINC